MHEINSSIILQYICNTFLTCYSQTKCHIIQTVSFKPDLIKLVMELKKTVNLVKT